jgi:hypothetical protein
VSLALRNSFPRKVDSVQPDETDRDRSPRPRHPSVSPGLPWSREAVPRGVPASSAARTGCTPGRLDAAAHRAGQPAAPAVHRDERRSWSTPPCGRPCGSRRSAGRVRAAAFLQRLRRHRAADHGGDAWRSRSTAGRARGDRARHQRPVTFGGRSLGDRPGRRPGGLRSRGLRPAPRGQPDRDDLPGDRPGLPRAHLAPRLPHDLVPAARRPHTTTRTCPAATPVDHWYLLSGVEVLSGRGTAASRSWATR